MCSSLDFLTSLGVYIFPRYFSLIALLAVTFSDVSLCMIWFCCFNVVNSLLKFFTCLHVNKWVVLLRTNFSLLRNVSVQNWHFSDCVAVI